MRKMISALTVFRPLNLLMIAAFQWATLRFLDFGKVYSPFSDARFAVMSIGLLCVSAAGYAINDFFDRKPDSINKPDKNRMHLWPYPVFLITYVVLNALGIWLSFQLGQAVGILVLSIVVLLFLYSAFLQKLPVIGNVLVASCVAFSILEVYLVFETLHFGLILFFTMMAWLLTLAREIVKDMQDLPGDAQAGYHTLPILAGIRETAFLVRGLILFSLGFYTYIHFEYIRDFFFGPLQWVYDAYQVSSVIAPLIYILYRSSELGTRRNEEQVSAWLKMVMVTGMGSLLFF